MSVRVSAGQVLRRRRGEAGHVGDPAPGPLPAGGFCDSETSRLGASLQKHWAVQFQDLNIYSEGWIQIPFPVSFSLRICMQAIVRVHLLLVWRLSPGAVWLL